MKIAVLISVWSSFVLSTLMWFRGDWHVMVVLWNFAAGGFATEAYLQEKIIELLEESKEG